MRLSSIGAHDIIERLQDAQRLAALVLIFMDASFDATVPEMFDEFRRLAEKLAPQQAEQAQDDTGGG